MRHETIFKIGIAILTISAVALILSCFVGCGMREYRHEIYSPTTGKLTQSYHAQIIDNLFDSKSTSSTLTLPDGTKWDLQGGSTAPDPNAMTMLTALGNAVVTAGGAALKFLGVP